MAGTISALEYLPKPGERPPLPVCVIFGNEPWLKRECLTALRNTALSEEMRDLNIARFSGAEAEWKDVVAELTTASLFGDGRQLVIVEEADPFVSAHRGQLEEYAAKPARTGVLVLVVGAWAANTKLYKAVDQVGLQIQCSLPKEEWKVDGEVKKWLPVLAKRHGVKLAGGAGERMLDLIGAEIGLLDQQLEKLTVIAAGGPITPELVDQHCGAWRTRSVWAILDAALEQRTAEALGELHRLLTAGEHPIGVLAALGTNLRQMALATHALEHSEKAGRRITLGQALKAAGVRWPEKMEARLKTLGRDRAKRLPALLLEVDLALKDYASNSEVLSRLHLERLLVMISAPQLRGGPPPRAAARR